jgi:predicted GNAT family acetyltransferase
MDATKRVVQNTEKSQFEVEGTDGMATLTYRETPDRITLLHTEVAPELAGQGLGSVLARGALDFARATNRKVLITCKFVKTYVARHPEYEDLLLRPIA